MKLEIKRYIFNTEVRSTIGDLLIDGIWFCYTLEDEIRADGVKEYGETALPAQSYKIRKTYSPKYKKLMLLIYNRTNEKGGYWIESPPDKDGNTVTWSGARIHGGNTEKDSLACVLAAYKTDGKKIWTRASDDLADKFNESEEYDLTITNQPFTYEGRFKIK